MRLAVSQKQVVPGHWVSCSQISPISRHKLKRSNKTAQNNILKKDTLLDTPLRPLQSEVLGLVQSVSNLRPHQSALSDSDGAKQKTLRAFRAQSAGAENPFV